MLIEALQADGWCFEIYSARETVCRVWHPTYDDLAHHKIAKGCADAPSAVVPSAVALAFCLARGVTAPETQEGGALAKNP